MFDEPADGWVTINISKNKDHHFYLSWMTDVLIDTMEAVIYCMLNHSPQTVYYDGEREDYHLIISDEQCALSYYNKDGKRETELINMNCVDIYNEIVDDYKKCKEEWDKWSYCFDVEPDSYPFAPEAVTYKEATEGTFRYMVDTFNKSKGQ